MHVYLPDVVERLAQALLATKPGDVVRPTVAPSVPIVDECSVPHLSETEWTSLGKQWRTALVRHRPTQSLSSTSPESIEPQHRKEKIGG
jgi:hypothetical protein